MLTMTFDTSDTTQLVTAVSTAIELKLEAFLEKLNLPSSFNVYNIAINDLSQNEWILGKPLMITVEQHGEEDFIACFYDADIYGYGDTIPEALDDLKEQLVGQLEFLLKEEKRVVLGVTPQKQLNVLRRHIKKGT
ncbi:MAG: hypothetical protein H8D67_30725 [Deltaproteobacteria bacterium]|nr:hypothetical protein [Deltaproteobacteria bacterium]